MCRSGCFSERGELITRLLPAVVALLALALLLPSAASALDPSLPPNLITFPGTQISDFETTADWAGSGGSLTANSDGYREGSRSLQLAVLAAGGTVKAQKIIQEDMSGGGAIRVWVYFHTDPTTTLAGLTIRFSPVDNPGPEYGMGRHFYRSLGPAGLHRGWNLISVAKSDLQAFSVGGQAPSWFERMVRVRLEAVARSGQFLSVSFDDLRYGVAASPAVIMSFKNDAANQFTNAYPIMQARGLRGNAFVVSSTVGKTGHLTVAQLQELYAAGWDVGTHGSTSAQLTSLGLAGAKQALIESSTFIAANGMLRGARHVAYPDGQYNDTVLQAMHDTGMLTGTMVDYRTVALPLDEPYMIPSTDAGFFGVAATKSRIDQAVREGAVIQLVFHDVEGSTSSGYTLSIADFTALADYIKDLGLPTLTISELYALNDDLLGPVQVDRWSPTTTASTRPGPGGDLTLTLSASDSLSGVAATYYRLDGAAAYSLYEGPVTLTGGVAHTLTYYSVDRAGNEETPTTMVDFSAPLTTAAGVADGWASGNGLLTLSATDDLSGVREIAYSLDGGEAWTVTAGSTAKVTIPTEGPATVTYRAVDTVGNMSRDETLELLVDNTPPESAVSGADDVWHTGPVSLMISAQDAPGGSGLKSIWYRVDSGEPVETFGNGPVDVTLSASGQHSVAYWSKDKAGNPEAVRSIAVRIAASPLPPQLTSYPGVQISGFESMAGWTVKAGSVGVNSTQYKEGAGSLQLSVLNPGGSAVAEMAIAPQEMSGGLVRFWVYLHTNRSNINKVKLHLSPTANFSKEFVYSQGMTGVHEGWNLISVGKSQFTAVNSPSWFDRMVAVKVELTTHAGTVASVSLDDLRFGVVATPAVVVSFDDGLASQFTNAARIMMERGLRGTTYVNSSTVGSSGKMTLAQLQQLYAAGWDIGNHSSSHPDEGLASLSSPASIEKELQDAADFLAANGMPRAARHVAYPAGTYNDMVLQAMATTGMLTGRLVSFRPAALPLDEPYLIPASVGDFPVDFVLSRIEQAEQAGATIHLFFHTVDGSSSSGSTVSVADFTAVMDYIKQRGIPTLTISEFYALSQGVAPGDFVAPTTTTDYDGLWHSGPVTLSFTATDAGSGVHHTEYSVGGGSWTAGAEVTVIDEGTTSISYRSADNAGNLEFTNTVAVKIDATPPEALATGNPAGWTAGEVTVTFTASDGASGLDTASVTCTVGGDAVPFVYGSPLVISTEGTHAVKFAISDLAGNQATAEVTALIDRIAPVSSVDYDGSWKPSDVTLTFGVMDLGGSGAAYTQASTNGGVTWVEGSSFTVSTEGTSTVLFRSVDNAGNVEAAKSVVVRIDKTPPAIVLTAPASGARYILGQLVAADWTVSDAASGLASASGTTASGALINTATFGNKSFSVSATDIAGNSGTKSVTYTVPFASPGLKAFNSLLRADGQSTFPLGTTVPLSFLLSAANGKAYNSAKPRLFVAQRQDDGSWSEKPAVAKPPVKGGNLFTNAGKGTYTYNLDTFKLAAGATRIRVDLGGGGAMYAEFILQ